MLIKKNRKMSTCSQLDLETWGYWPIMPQNWVSLNTRTHDAFKFGPHPSLPMLWPLEYHRGSGVRLYFIIFYFVLFNCLGSSIAKKIAYKERFQNRVPRSSLTTIPIIRILSIFLYVDDVVLFFKSMSCLWRFLNKQFQFCASSSPGVSLSQTKINHYIR